MDPRAIAGAIALLIGIVLVAAVVAPTVFPLANDLTERNETWIASGLNGFCQNATGDVLARTATAINFVFNNSIQTSSSADFTYFSGNNSLKCVDSGILIKNNTYGVSYNYRDPSYIQNPTVRTIINVVPVLLAVLVVLAVIGLLMAYAGRGGGGRGF